MYSLSTLCLAVTVQLQGVASLPGSMSRAADGKVELVTLAQTTALLARRCEATHFPVLVHSLGNPLSVGVASDGFVEGVNEDDFKELVCGIFTHPVGIQNPQTSTVTASTLLK